MNRLQDCFDDDDAGDGFAGQLFQGMRHDPSRPFPFARLGTLSALKEVGRVPVSYDGLGRRITETPAGKNPTQLYYSSGWQDIQENISAADGTIPLTVHADYVWSPVYVDAMVLRDFDFAGGGLALNDRLYVVQDANFNVTALISHRTLVGDCDGDGSVGFNDLVAILQGYNGHPQGGDAMGDFDHDSNINFNDLVLLLQQYNAHANSTTSFWLVGERMVYDSYGKFTYCWGGFETAHAAWTTRSDYLAWNYGRNGLRWDKLTFTYENRRRIYSCTLDRFLQQDPMGYVDGLNDYFPYADNPINRRDPSGLASEGQPGWTGGMVRPANEPMYATLYDPRTPAPSPPMTWGEIAVLAVFGILSLGGCSKPPPMPSTVGTFKVTRDPTVPGGNPAGGFSVDFTPGSGITKGATIKLVQAIHTHGYGTVFDANPANIPVTGLPKGYVEAGKLPLAGSTTGGYRDAPFAELAFTFSSTSGSLHFD